MSLQRLEILSDQNDGTAFRLWVNNYPCRASILVQKILDGLTYSTSALSVLEKLCTASEVMKYELEHAEIDFF